MANDSHSASNVPLKEAGELFNNTLGSEGLDNTLSPPARESLADKVLEQMREAIFNGRFAPGEQLRVSQLAELFKVSPGPIREALNQLEREGLAVIRPNRTALVARLAKEDFEEVYSLRLALERLAVQCAIHNITPVELDDMQVIVDQMIERVADDITEQEAADLDLQFHDVLYRASYHKRLQISWENLRPQIHIFLLSRNVADSDFRAQMIGHQEIINVIRAGNEDEAIQCIEEHIRFAYDRIIKSYGA